MRIAENEQACSAGDFSFQIIKIHLETTVDFFQRIEHYFPVIFGGYIQKRRIYGWLHDDFIVGLRECIDAESQPRNYTGQKAEPLSVHLPLMLFFNPVDHTFVIILAWRGVTKNGMLQSFCNRIGDKVGSTKIHVGHPKWYQIIGSEKRFAFFNLNGTGIVPVDNFVKVIFHTIFLSPLKKEKLC